MKIKINECKDSPYVLLSAFLDRWASKHKVYCDLIVDIQTGVLGKDRVIATRTEYGCYFFEDDWYEGGDVELLGITPIDEIEEPKYKFYEISSESGCDGCDYNNDAFHSLCTVCIRLNPDDGEDDFYEPIKEDQNEDS